MAACAFAHLMLGISNALDGGPLSMFLPWLAIPATTLASRFSMRGVVVGVLWTAAT